MNDLRRLLLSPGARRSTCVEAEQLLRVHHTDTPGALDTARLLLTDRRWDRLSGLLVRALVGTGLLGQEGLDVLAVKLVCSETLVYGVDQLFTDGWFTVELPSRDGVEHDADADTDDLVGSGEPVTDEPLVTLRRIPPPLRRWAAARITRRALLAEPRPAGAPGCVTGA